MLSLLRLFSHQIESWCLRFLFFGTCWVLAFDKIGLGHEAALGSLYALIHVLPFVLLPRLVAANLGWLIALPLPRANLLILNYATNGLTIGSMWICYVLLAQAVQWTLEAGQATTPGYASFFLPFDSNGASSVAAWTRDGALTWLARLAWMGFVHWRCLTLSPVAGVDGWYRHAWHHPDPSLRRAFRWAGALGTIGLVVAGLTRMPPMFWFAAAVLFFNVSPAVCSAWSLAIPARSRARWVAASVIPAIGFIALALVVTRA